MTTKTTERDLVTEVEELLATFPRRRLLPLSDWEVERVRRLVEEVKRLRRGEFICQRCHHRKDAEFEPGDF